MPLRTDEELLLAVQRSEPAALAELYLRHAPRMLGVARRVLGTRRDAEDTLQDVFLELWQCARDYESARGSAVTWLFVRVRSRALDRRRARERSLT
ncbi:MAG TPA: sigma-70 family RNA polymerase sigma factor, partial [Polyangiaceae bacterium]|nr:sigma-70 family RNA polymerase sigma factor [Polyangiaceae bacterium]